MSQDGRIKINITAKTNLFKVVYSEHMCMWYIENTLGQKVRIRTAGKDTGINKSWCSKRSALIMCHRLNKGESPATVVIP